MEPLPKGTGSEGIAREQARDGESDQLRHSIRSILSDVRSSSESTAPGPNRHSSVLEVPPSQFHTVPHHASRRESHNAGSYYYDLRSLSDHDIGHSPTTTSVFRSHSQHGSFDDDFSRHGSTHSAPSLHSPVLSSHSLGATNWNRTRPARYSEPTYSGSFTSSGNGSSGIGSEGPGMWPRRLHMGTGAGGFWGSQPGAHGARDAPGQLQPGGYATDTETRPPHSYALLIQQALDAGGPKSLKEIYEWIESNYAYYRRLHTEGGSYRSTVRHTLVTNRIFRKIGLTDPTSGKTQTRWMVDPAAQRAAPPRRRTTATSVVGATYSPQRTGPGYSNWPGPNPNPAAPEDAPQPPPGSQGF